MSHSDRLSAGESWLLWACSRTPERRPSAPFPGDANSALTLPEFCELADRQGVLGLVLVAIERAGLTAALPTDEARELAKTLAFLRRKSALWQFECGMLLARYRQAGLHPVVLKGAALQVTAYDEPVQRSFGDIDLLFPEDEIKPAMRVLEQLGYVAPAEESAASYEALHFHYVMDKPNGFKVEVHWALERPDSSFVLDTKAFVANTRVVASKALGEFRTPVAEYAALHLSVQNLENGFAKLSRLVDIDRLVSSPGFDWSLLQTITKAANARVVVHTSLSLCAQLLGTPVPASVLHDLGASPSARWHMATLEPVRVVLEQRAQQRAAVSLLIDLWCRDSTTSRLSGVGDMLAGRDLALGRSSTLQARPVEAAKNAFRVLKLATYQLWLYGRRPFVHVAQTLPEYTQ